MQMHGGTFTVQHGGPPPEGIAVSSVGAMPGAPGAGGLMPINNDMGPMTSLSQQLPPHLLSNGVVDGSSPHLPVSHPGLMPGPPSTPRDDMASGLPPPPPSMAGDFPPMMVPAQFSEAGGLPPGGGLLPPMNGPPHSSGPPQHLMGVSGAAATAGDDVVAWSNRFFDRN